MLKQGDRFRGLRSLDDNGQHKVSWRISGVKQKLRQRNEMGLSLECTNRGYISAISPERSAKICHHYLTTLPMPESHLMFNNENDPSGAITSTSPPRQYPCTQMPPTRPQLRDHRSRHLSYPRRQLLHMPTSSVQAISKHTKEM